MLWYNVGHIWFDKIEDQPFFWLAFREENGIILQYPLYESETATFLQDQWYHCSLQK